MRPITFHPGVVATPSAWVYTLGFLGSGESANYAVQVTDRSGPRYTIAETS